jgi:hypothetical protein
MFQLLQTCGNQATLGAISGGGNVHLQLVFCYLRVISNSLLGNLHAYGFGAREK